MIESERRIYEPRLNVQNPEQSTRSQRARFLKIDNAIDTFTLGGGVSQDEPPVFGIGTGLPYEYDLLFVRMCNDQPSRLHTLLNCFRRQEANQIYVNGGYVYVTTIQNRKRTVVEVWDIKDVFKIYADKETKKIRLVMRKENKFTTKEFVAENMHQTLKQLLENLEAIGKVLV